MSADLGWICTKQRIVDFWKWANFSGKRKSNYWNQIWWFTFWPERFERRNKIREVKTRINQNVFRQIVVANYSGKCAITGIDIPELLFASHIIPWSKNEDERLNPENGICLSALYDKAYDKGLIGLNEKYEILISSRLKKKQQNDYYGKYFSHLENSKLVMPQKYMPKKEFLQYHLDEIFEKNFIMNT